MHVNDYIHHVMLVGITPACVMMAVLGITPARVIMVGITQVCSCVTAKRKHCFNSQFPQQPT